ncbi:DUF1127 domain-containing protein [Marivita sp. S6314]|uniref:DUF1127 domain-containing protein n=1 Tax=Marivita sp. S6314 TaxID=2926406 RepID=UPI001FF20392|nr:DUF1127 domain-containing protein [Marivita sp. S6314]MCK0149112.1 DUF1127 domain-containing protein [Marivita sp. S6314]
MMSMMENVFGRSYARTSQATVLERVNAALALRRSRAQLAALDAHLLADIGIAQDVAAAEAARPIWDTTAPWKR